MIKSTQYISLLAALALLGCQAQTSTAPSIEPAPSVSMSLPAEFSQSYQIAFQENPKLTALRFLQAFDEFEIYGPVTTKTVRNHARLQASLERGQRLGGILAMDLNADGLITRIEFETLSGLPNGNKKAARMAGLFEFDANQDDLMSFEEAIRFGERLNARQPEPGLRPIESYLMLFDLNTDGHVMREEVVKALYIYLPQHERSAASLRPSRMSP